MAKQTTTNLSLTKYSAGTDNFIRTDYNGNMDKIDQYAGTTNTAIADLEVRTAGTSSNPITNLNDIPQNSRGITCLDSSVAPSGVGSSITLNYQKFGNSAGTSSTILLSRPGYLMLWANFLASGTWQGWVLLTGSVSFTVPASSSISVTLPKSGRYNVHFSGNANGLCGLAAVYANSGGTAVRVSSTTPTTNITLSASGQVLTIANSNTSTSCDVYFDCLTGSIPTLNT